MSQVTHWQPKYKDIKADAFVITTDPGISDDELHIADDIWLVNRAA